MSLKKKGLGSKGLGIEALINNKINELNEINIEKINILEIDINLIKPNIKQPRKTFNEYSLNELSDSIKNYGVLQPIIVKQIDDVYQIVAGERRWRASKIAGLKKIPVLIKNIDEIESFETALIENLQREDLNPIEEARGYKSLLEKLSLSQEEIAKKVGKNRSTISNSLRLLNLDERVQDFVVQNELTNGHARAILGILDKDEQFDISKKIINEKLSVRETERLVKKFLESKNIISKTKKNINKKDCSNFTKNNYKYVENELKDILGTKVKIFNNKNKGKIEIEYYSDDDLDRLIGIIKNDKIL